MPVRVLRPAGQVHVVGSAKLQESESLNARKGIKTDILGHVSSLLCLRQNPSMPVRVLRPELTFEHYRRVIVKSESLNARKGIKTSRKRIWLAMIVQCQNPSMPVRVLRRPIRTLSEVSRSRIVRIPQCP